MSRPPAHLIALEPSGLVLRGFVATWHLATANSSGAVRNPVAILRGKAFEKPCEAGEAFHFSFTQGIYDIL